MKNVNKLIIWFIITIFVITVLLIIFWFSQKDKEDFESVVISKEDNKKYVSTLITTYDEYQDILEEYNVLGKLSYRDFEEKDYLLDFLGYEDDLIVNAITINLGEEIIISYKLNKKINDSNDKLLMNIIPIDKDIVNKDIEIKQNIE